MVTHGWRGDERSEGGEEEDDDGVSGKSWSLKLVEEAEPGAFSRGELSVVTTASRTVVCGVRNENRV